MNKPNKLLERLKNHHPQEEVDSALYKYMNFHDEEIQEAVTDKTLTQIERAAAGLIKRICQKSQTPVEEEFLRTRVMKYYLPKVYESEKPKHLN